MRVRNLIINNAQTHLALFYVAHWQNNNEKTIISIESSVAYAIEKCLCPAHKATPNPIKIVLKHCRAHTQLNRQQCTHLLICLLAARKQKKKPRSSEMFSLNFKLSCQHCSSTTIQLILFHFLSVCVCLKKLRPDDGYDDDDDEINV